jgi:enoyl-CoA hydratase/carnithine racemase
VIAAVQGLCQAQGTELALACDLVIAGQSARFAQTEAIIGATTFLGGVYRLARRCSMARALEIVHSTEIARPARGRSAWRPTRAYRMTKHLLRTYDVAGLAAADAALLCDAVTLWDSRDMRESVARLLGVERAKMRFVALSFTGA